VSVTDKLKWRRVEVMDSAGNVINPAKHEDLYDADEAKTITAILKELRDKLTNVSAYGSIASGDNTAGFSVSLEVAHRSHVEVWCKLGGAGDIKVYGSRNGTDWRLVDSASLSAAGEWHKGYLNGYPHIKVEVPTTGIDVEIEITANP